MQKISLMGMKRIPYNHSSVKGSNNINDTYVLLIGLPLRLVSENNRSL